jgi:hypothetical protein
MDPTIIFLKNLVRSKKVRVGAEAASRLRGLRNTDFRLNKNPS